MLIPEQEDPSPADFLFLHHPFHLQQAGLQGPHSHSQDERLPLAQDGFGQDAEAGSREDYDRTGC